MRPFIIVSFETLFLLGLFVRKWKNVEPEATRLLRKSFFKKNKNWYIGCAARVPKHNNGMDNFNSTMKRCQNEHQREPLKQFIPTALGIVRQRSKQYWKDKQPFHSELHISNEIIAKGREMTNNFVYDREKMDVI